MHFLFGCTAFQPSNSPTPPTDGEGILRIARKSRDRMGTEGLRAQGGSAGDKRAQQGPSENLLPGEAVL